MEGFIAVSGIALAFASTDANVDRAVAYDWPASLVVEVDLDRSGRKDAARLGIAAGSVGLLVTIDDVPLPVIDIPVDGSMQFGICGGSDLGIRVEAQSEAPLEALGETPRGYEICATCVEIVVSGGDCDPLHFYWDVTARTLAWWRA